MNKIFADHVTNTAFFLSVSKKQMHYLEVLYKNPYSKDINGGYYQALLDRSVRDSWYVSMNGLEKKGLAIRVIDKQERNEGHWELTKAGELLCEMLVEAGLITSREIKAVA